jgi:sporulation protein YlmC with PRC-barrel domain
MMRRFATLCATLPLLTATAVFAQRNDTNNRSGEVRRGDTTVRENSSMTNKDMQQQGDVSKDMTETKRISKCMGENVYGNDGKKLGDIKDVVLDSRDTHISYAVLSYGGILGMGDKYYAVPWGALHHKGTDNKTYLDVTSDQLKDAPSFDKNHWPDMADSTFRNKVNTFYHYEDTWDRDMNSRTGGTMEDRSAMKDNTKWSNKDNQMSKGLFWTRRASEVIGTNVTNASNESLGEIKDLVADQSGRVRYAVLSFGGVMGIGDKLFAVPMDSLHTKADQQKFVLNVTKDHLKNAPGFNEKNWPNFADTSFRNSVDQFYKTGEQGTAKTE